MNTKHTPAPWAIDKWGQVNDSNGQQILLRGVALASGNHSKRDEAEANTILIAAAPEMLEALVELMKLYNGQPQMAGAYKKANSIIAKATGEQA